MSAHPPPLRAGGSEALQATLDALASPIRREILWMVWEHELPAGEIAAAFEVTAATISSHLSALRRAGLVTMRVDGNFRRYRAERDALDAVLPLLAAGSDRWQVADAIPEQRHAESTVGRWVSVTVALRQAAREDAFDAFVDDERFSAWLGVPVTLRAGRFSAELEWGTKVRGHYEVVARPDLLALRWDFDDDAVPAPGRQLVAYVRFTQQRSTCRVEVHQQAADAEQADFLTVAWAMVLGRLREHHERHGRHAVGGPGGAAAPTRRAPRPKRSSR